MANFYASYPVQGSGGGGGGGTVTSVALTLPGIFTESGSPITSAGTITVGLTTEPANEVFAGPASGADATPTFRPLVAADLPSGTGTVTSVSVTTNAGISGTVANPTTTPAISLTLGAITPSSVNASGTVAGSNLSGTNTGDQTITLTGDVTGSGTGSFAVTVQSVGGSSASAVNTATTLVNGVEAAHLVLAGPTSGTAVPTFRALVSGDLPAGTGSVTSVGFADTSTTPIYTITGSPVTGSGTIDQTLNTQSSAMVFAGPVSGVATQPTFRSLTATDIPTLNQNTTGTSANVTGTVLIGHGGTGQTTATSAYNALSPMTATGDMEYEISTGTAARLPVGSTGNVLTVSGGVPTWAAPATSGTVTSVSVVSANGLAGTVATSTTTPAITLSTSVTGILSGNGTAISAATTTGTGNVVLSTSPVLTSPSLDTPTLLTLTNATGLPLTTGVTGTLPIANGGTNATTASAAFDNLNPMTTTGDIIYESAANTASRLAVGSTNQVLTVVGGVPTWVTPSSPGTGTVTSVSVVSANGLAGTVATSTTTPAITLSTTITGILQGNGTAISAASTTGSGAVVLATSPTLTTPALGTPSALVLTNATGLPVAGGGTGAATFTAHGVLLGEGTSAVGVTAVGTTGQVLTGVTSSDPVWATPVAASTTTAGTLTYYDSSTFGATFTQAGGYSQAVTVVYVRVGNMVTLRIPHFQGTTTATAAGISSQAGAVLSTLRPATTIQFVAPIRNNGVQGAGSVEITSAGTINLMTDLNGTGFTISGSAGLTGGDDWCCSYPIT